jgi:hypothetical protein
MHDLETLNDTSTEISRAASGDFLDCTERAVLALAVHLGDGKYDLYLLIINDDTKGVNWRQLRDHVFESGSNLHLRVDSNGQKRKFRLKS